VPIFVGFYNRWGLVSVLSDDCATPAQDNQGSIYVYIKLEYVSVSMFLSKK